MPQDGPGWMERRVDEIEIKGSLAAQLYSIGSSVFTVSAEFQRGSRGECAVQGELLHPGQKQTHGRKGFGTPSKVFTSPQTPSSTSPAQAQDLQLLCHRQPCQCQYYDSHSKTHSINTQLATAEPGKHRRLTNLTPHVHPHSGVLANRNFCLDPSTRPPKVPILPNSGQQKPQSDADLTCPLGTDMPVLTNRNPRPSPPRQSLARNVQASPPVRRSRRCEAIQDDTELQNDW